MRLYTIYGCCMYGDGMAIVAARSQKAAIQVLKDAELACWNNGSGLEFDTATIISGASIGGVPRVLCETSYIE